MNPIRSTETLQAFEKVYANGEGPYGLRVLWDVKNGEVFNAYPFRVVARSAQFLYDSVPWPF